MTGKETKYRTSDGIYKVNDKCHLGRTGGKTHRPAERATKKMRNKEIGSTSSTGYCEDLGETLCPPEWAGMADVTRRVAAESSFALAKGNVGFTVFSSSTLN